MSADDIRGNLSGEYTLVFARHRNDGGMRNGVYKESQTMGRGPMVEKAFQQCPGVERDEDGQLQVGEVFYKHEKLVE